MIFKFSGQTKKAGVIGALFSATIFLVATSSAAQADCRAPIGIMMNKAYSFQILKDDGGGNYTEVQRISLAPGESESFQFKDSYGGMLIKISEGGKEVTSIYTNAENLANCTFAQARYSPFCTGYPRAQDLTMMPPLMNCGLTISN